jgi:hypothetical protein
VGSKRAFTYLGRLAAAWIAVSGAMASEYHGAAKSGGLPVPGVTVTATQGDKKITTTTDQRGVFSFPDLADGAWTIEVEMLGFEKITRQVGVAPGAAASEWELKFMSEAALVASLNPGQAFPGTKIGGQAPLSTRSTRSAGAPGDRGASPRFSVRLDVNQSTDSTAFGTEGAIRNDEVADLSPSAADSFIVQGSMSTALGMAQRNDWGFPPPGMGMEPPGAPGMAGAGSDDRGLSAQGGARNPGEGGPPPGGGPGRPGGPGGPEGFGGPGGGRQGWQGRPNAMAFGNARRNPRNTYMASAFFSLDNSVWDARTFSVTGANLDKPSYANGRGGVMLGGPLQIPTLVSREKQIFFSFNLQFQRNRTGATSDPVNMPAALERSGDFSQTPAQGAAVTIYDPATGMPFAGNKIPASRLSATAAALLKYYPDPNLPYAARNYQTTWSGSNNSYNLNARLSNIKIGSRNRLNGGVGYQSSNSVSPNLFQFIDTGSGRGINASLGWSRNVTTRLINNLQYSFSRNRQLSSPYFANRENVAAELGILGTSQNPANWGPPNLSFTNYAGLSDGN